MTVLSKLVSVVRMSMNDMHISFLFLSAGRQLEPHQCNHLFPLPLSRQPSIKSVVGVKDDMPSAMEVNDLYSFAVIDGSLTVAASALPLLTPKQFTHKQCIQLFHHSISSIVNICIHDEKFHLSCLREECLYLRQLYLYGLK